MRMSSLPVVSHFIPFPPSSSSSSFHLAQQLEPGGSGWLDSVFLPYFFLSAQDFLVKSFK